MVLPSFHDVALRINHIDFVGQNSLLIEEIERGIAVRAVYWTYKLFFYVIPKADCQVQLQTIIDHIHGEAPSDEEPLALGGANLSWIGCVYMRAGQKIAVDPLLLYIEVVLIT